MELSKLTGSLAAYGNNAAQGNQTNQAGQATGSQLDPRVAQSAGKSATGSAPVPESTRVTLSQDGLRRAAEDAQANQQVSEMAAQAAVGRVSGNASIDRNEAENPRSAAVIQTDMPEANARPTRGAGALNDGNRSQSADDNVQAQSSERRTESSTRVGQQRTDERQQQARQEEQKRILARQDAPPAAAQAGVAAYRGVFAY